MRLLAGHHRPPVVDTPVIVSKVMDSLFSVSAAPEGIRCSFQSKEFRILSFLCTYKLHCRRVYLVLVLSSEYCTTVEAHFCKQVAKIACFGCFNYAALHSDRKMINFYY